jgi:hypothetical protein
MLIWNKEDWIKDTNIINYILPIVYLGLYTFTKKIKNDMNILIDTNYDIIIKILSFVYHDKIFDSPLNIYRINYNNINIKNRKRKSSCIKKINFDI